MKKIVVIGPESTGKSTLCKELAKHYGTAWCPEYAREYLRQNGTAYTYGDLLKIALGQVTLEDDLQHDAKGQYYFIDTDLYVIKVWYEVAFQHCPAWILKQIARRHCDLYLLCRTDLPWTHDEQREHPDPVMRQRLFRMYKDVVLNSGVPWVEISGTEHQRLQKATQAIDAIF